MSSPVSKVTKAPVPGPLAPFAGEVQSGLRAAGYTPLTTVNLLRLMADLSRWLESNGLSVAELNDQRVEEYLEARRAAGRTSVFTPRGVAPVLNALDTLGVLPSVERAPTVACSPVDQLLASFGEHLAAERGLGWSTVDFYLRSARRFLSWSAPNTELGSVTAGDVTGAMVRESQRVSASSAQYFACGLRAFLRFCFIEGLTDQDLSAAALPVTGRHCSPLPQDIPTADAKALLDSCDRRSSQGRRDYAVLMVLLRLGLRAGEVAALKLDDIDWRAAEITVAGKGGRHDRLPLSAEVGEAIAGYLTRGRPKGTADRHVFLRAIAPTGPIGRGGVGSLVRRACVRAGIEPVGPHRLRHTVACHMVADGAPLTEVGQLLRHHSTTSSAIYGRVDVEALRGLARPWPGEVAR